MGKFKIPVTPSTTNKTIRFPDDVVAQVEEAIKGKECTFSAFVIAAVRAALEDLKNEERHRFFVDGVLFFSKWRIRQKEKTDLSIGLWWTIQDLNLRLPAAPPPHPRFSACCAGSTCLRHGSQVQVGEKRKDTPFDVSSGGRYRT